MRRIALLSLVTLTACFSSASSGSGGSPEFDGGLDASFDGGGGEDVTVEAAPEAGPVEASADTTVPLDANSPVDSGAPEDATSPIEAAGPDAAPIVDAGVDATPHDAAPPFDAGLPDAALVPIHLGPSANRAAVALGPDGIYFTLFAQTALYRAPYGGGAAVVLVAAAVSAGGGSGPLAADAANVYWQDLANYHVYSLPFGSSVGATPTTITTQAQVPLGQHMVAYQGQLYIAIGGGGLARVPIVPPSTPATNAAIAMAGSSSCGSLGCDPTIAVTAQGVFWTVSYPASMGGGIYGCALEGDAGYSNTGTLVVSTDYVNAVTNDSNNLYWVTAGPSGSNGSAIMAPLTDGGVGTAVTIASGIGNAQGIAVDTSTNPPVVFWTNSAGTGFVAAAPAISSGTVVTLASAQGAPYDISANAQAVVWTQLSVTGGGVQEIVR